MARVTEVALTQTLSFLPASFIHFIHSFFPHACAILSKCPIEKALAVTGSAAQKATIKGFQ